ncbi:MAG: tetratricopeptide repeat protein [Polyangiaceae bacterium]
MLAWFPSYVIRCFLLVFLFSSLLTAAARAGTVDSAAAQTLFERGRALMLEQRYAEACEKFAESQALEAEVGTLLNLALCHEQVGKLATAYLEYNDALASSLRASDTARVLLARQRLAELEPRLARVTLTIEEPKTSPGLWVKLDGTSLGVSALDMPIPVDLGRHEVDVGANGKLSVHLELQIEQAATTYPVKISPLIAVQTKPSDSANAPPLNRAIGERDGSRATYPSPPHAGDGPRATSRTSMIAGVSIGIATAATLIGTYFGIDAINQWDERNRHCTSKGCDEEAVRAKARAERSARMSNLCFGTGLLAGGVGLYVVFTADTKGADLRAATPNATSASAASASAASASATMIYASGVF